MLKPTYKMSTPITCQNQVESPSTSCAELGFSTSKQTRLPASLFSESYVQTVTVTLQFGVELDQHCHITPSLMCVFKPAGGYPSGNISPATLQFGDTMVNHSY